MSIDYLKKRSNMTLNVELITKSTLPEKNENF